MSVEVKSMSRAKAMLIAVGVLLVGLAIIFGIKYLTTASSAPGDDTATLQKSEK